MSSASPHIVVIEAALRALAEGAALPSFRSPEGAALQAAIGAVVSSCPIDLQRVGLIALQVVNQATRADAITERVFGLASNGSRP